MKRKGLKRKEVNQMGKAKRGYRLVQGYHRPRGMALAKSAVSHHLEKIAEDDLQHDEAIEMVEQWIKTTNKKGR